MMPLRRIKSLLWFVLGAGMVTIAARLLTGLGAVTNLSHNVSWGLWNAVKISIVPLSAGGFVLAAIVYVFHMERFRPVLRLAILTGFLGYSTFATMLMFDIGVPYRIWHPMVYWQHHSVLFEVAWCVMLYLTVLALEFLPNVLEHPLLKHPLLQKGYKLLKSATVPLVTAGIVLSTLHQSSLGSLFLIVPHRLDPLWYSPLIHALFLVSAVGMGLLVIAVEAVLIERLYGVKAPLDVLAPLARAGAVVMALFLAVRLADQVARGVLPGALSTSPMAAAFVLETLIASIVPLLLLRRSVRESRGGLFACSLSAVLGVVWYRSNVALLAIDWGEAAYFPAWTEFALCFGILAGSGLVFFLLLENLDIYYGPAASGRDREPQVPGLAFEAWLADARITAARRYSLFIVAGAAAAVLFLPEGTVFGARPADTPAAQARRVRGLSVRTGGGRVSTLRLGERPVPAKGRVKRLPLYLIDGDRDEDAVLFDHAGHVKRAGGEKRCGVCHHLNMPLDENTSCHECHRDMYEPASVFSHASHVRELGGNAGCVKCHEDPLVVKDRRTAVACGECHSDSAAKGSFVEAPGPRWGAAPGYADAMHGLCESCHKKKAKEEPGRYPAALGRCAACHDTDRPMDIRRMAPRSDRMRAMRAEERGLSGG
ncbi:MAG: NrfD/PsrC family molybdoenzyme membrane anchor subunit [Elusimicrobiota bacterium]